MSRKRIAESSNAALDTLFNAGAITECDRRFAQFINRLGAGGSPYCAIAAALVSRASADGHACLELSLAPDQNPRLDAAECPPTSAWVDALRQSAAVGEPGDYRPLIIHKNRLYLHRLWTAQQRLATNLRARLAARTPIPQTAGTLLKRLFPDDEPVDWQCVAAFAALRQKACVITGGPGSGKTTAIARILAAIQERESGSRTLCAAPTGKAAQRMSEALAAAVASFGAPIPVEATTIHRLLGIIPRSTRFRHGPDNPVPADTVVIDEASMVDLPLMDRLCAALPATCRLLLVGDRNQLASVDVGSVLGDLCPPDAAASFSPEFRQEITQATGMHLPRTSGKANALADGIVELKRGYRFNQSIATVSSAVNQGDVDAALRCLESGAPDADVVWTAVNQSGAMQARLAALTLEGFEPYVQANTPAAALDAFRQFRVLCALRTGATGVDAINQMVERALFRAGKLAPLERFYERRPIMITRNEYSLNLYNGDIGVIMRDQQGGDMRAFFAGPGSALRAFAPSRLPPHETAFAMTIHKSQGSEHDRVLILLPDRDTPVLTRELLYTALTRARRRVWLWGSRETLTKCITRITERSSGLREALWDGCPDSSCASPARGDVEQMTLDL